MNSVQVVFNGNLAKISTSNQSKDNHVVFLENITSNIELNHSANLVVTPFIIDHDGEIKFEMYEGSNNSVINSFTADVGNITINLYTRASMVEDTSAN